MVGVRVSASPEGLCPRACPFATISLVPWKRKCNLTINSHAKCILLNKKCTPVKIYVFHMQMMHTRGLRP